MAEVDNMKKNIRYPRTSRRMRAFLLDGLIVPIGAISTLIIVSNLGFKGYYPAVLASLVVFLLEPLSITITGGTLGHHILGLRVVSKYTLKNINIFTAILRFVIKIPLGLFSLISIFITRQHQAIHDSLVGSIVILKNPQAMKSHEVLSEREIEKPGYIYPSKLRRSLIMVLYVFIIYVVYIIVLTLSLSENCVLYGKCEGVDSFLAFSLSILWIIAVVVSINLAWKGLLYGCRRISKGA